LFAIFLVSCNSGKTSSGNSAARTNGVVPNSSSDPNQSSGLGTSIKKENFISVKLGEVISIENASINNDAVTVTFKSKGGDTSTVSLPKKNRYKEVTEEDGRVFGEMIIDNDRFEMLGYIYVHKSNNNSIGLGITVGKMESAKKVFESNFYPGLVADLFNKLRFIDIINDNKRVVSSFVIQNNARNKKGGGNKKYKYDSIVSV
jgi:hypothetical protein